MEDRKTDIIRQNQMATINSDMLKPEKTLIAFLQGEFSPEHVALAYPDPKLTKEQLEMKIPKEIVVPKIDGVDIKLPETEMFLLNNDDNISNDISFLMKYVYSTKPKECHLVKLPKVFKYPAIPIEKINVSKKNIFFIDTKSKNIASVSKIVKSIIPWKTREDNTFFTQPMGVPVPTVFKKSVFQNIQKPVIQQDIGKPVDVDIRFSISEFEVEAVIDSISNPQVKIPKIEFCEFAIHKCVQNVSISLPSIKTNDFKTDYIMRCPVVPKVVSRVISINELDITTKEYEDLSFTRIHHINIQNFVNMEPAKYETFNNKVRAVVSVPIIQFPTYEISNFCMGSDNLERIYECFRLPQNEKFISQMLPIAFEADKIWADMGGPDAFIADGLIK